MNRIILLCIALMTITLQSFALEQVITWDAKAYSTDTLNQYELHYVATIEKGWNTYSSYMEEGGPVPTAISYTEGKQELVDSLIEKGTLKVAFDKLFGMEVQKLSGDVVLVQKVQSTEAAIDAVLTFMSCNDTKCLPPEDIDLKFDLANASPLASAAAVASAPVVKEKKELSAKEASPMYRASIDKASIDDDCTGISEKSGKDNSLWWLFLLGFGGGFLALLTPCVFPMIPVTVSYFMDDKKTKAEGVRDALVYGASIIIIYVGLGAIVTATLGADGLNWLATHWIANLIFFATFIVFAFSFFGFFEITLPSSWLNKSDQMSRSKGGYLGIFFMAFTLALVSFSCTGLVIGTILPQAASTGNLLAPIVVMAGFAIALALPFTASAMFPKFLESMPKSGGWLNSVKIILGFLEIAFAFKFLSIAEQTEGWNFLHYETNIVIWILCMLGIALYVFGVIKFKYDSPIKKLESWRWIVGVLSIASIAYLSIGLVNPPLKLLSGILPAANHSIFKEKVEVATTDAHECAAGLSCYKDYEAGLAAAKAQNKPLIVDFTGHGCVNCRKMEENAWPVEGVNKIMKEDYILVSLYVDERTKLPKSDQYYSEASGKKKKIRNVGARWSDFQISNFNVASQPYYVLMSPNEEVLRAPVSYISDAAEFQEFLECGLAKNEALK